MYTDNNSNIILENNISGKIEAERKKKSAIGVIAVIAVIAVVVFLIYKMIGTSEDKYIEFVKSSRFDNYPSVTVGAAFDDFFQNPEWSSGVDSNGDHFVNFNGICQYYGKNVTMWCQFKVYDNYFEVYYIGPDKKEMSDFEMNQIIDDIMTSY